MTRASAVIRPFRRMPDFAGVALVDILANGVAMLIIVIVVTIAARMEREERFAEQADEVAAVMSHKFSTSLVLNSLAASPPARLHDYETSPLDQVLDPDLLPILELHPGFVREYYSGTIWTRRDLLEEHNSLGAWLAEFSDERKARLRVDVYDIPQFYLTMSILREHGIRVFHWHFLVGALPLGAAARCPPGVAAKDCPGGGSEAPAPLPQLALDNRASGGVGDSDSPLFEPPSGTGRGAGGAGDARNVEPDRAAPSPGPMPGGVVPGMAGSAGAGFGGQGDVAGTAGTRSQPDGGFADARGAGRGAGDGDREAAGTERGLLTGPDGAGRSRGFGADGTVDPDAAATLGSFPGARGEGGDPFPGPGRGQPRRDGQGGAGRGEPPRAGSGSGEAGPQFSLRIALPESVRREAQSGSQGVAALEAMFGIILHYLGALQDTLDAGGTPSPQIDGFAERILRAFRAPPPSTEAERQIARDLALKFALLPHLGTPAFRPEPLALRPAPPGPRADAVLVVAPNRLNDELGVHRGGAGPDGEERHPRQADGERPATGASEGAGQAERPDSPGDPAPLLSDLLSDRGRATLALNAYPGIWKGLDLRVEPYSVLLMPPEAHEPERTRWRAVAYVTPRLDDFIVGFVFAAVDDEGRLRMQADANRVQIDGRPLFTEYRESAFGSRGWLVSLYAALALGLALLAVGWRYLAVRAA